MTAIYSYTLYILLRATLPYVVVNFSYYLQNVKFKHDVCLFEIQPRNVDSYCYGLQYSWNLFDLSHLLLENAYTGLPILWVHMLKLCLFKMAYGTAKGMLFIAQIENDLVKSAYMIYLKVIYSRSWAFFPKITVSHDHLDM